MKILILNWKSPTDSSAGGAERYVLEVATRWADNGHEVTIFGPRSAVNPTTILNRRPHLKYVGAGSRITVFRAAARYLRSSGGQFDWVLESVSTRPFAAHKVVGGKAVALYHQTAEEVWGLEFPPPIAWLGRRVLEPHWVRGMRGARVVANSRSTALVLERFGVKSEAVVPPGCEPPVFCALRQPPGPHPRLLWIGRMVRTKRPEDAMLAFALVRELIPGAHLDMVGTGYLEARLQARSQPGVTFHGHVSEVEKGGLLARSDLLLLPGTREGWGIVVLEAASFGMPTVAYDIPGLRDAVVDGRTGCLVEPSPRALGEAAAALLTCPKKWETLSRAARLRATEYTWDVAAASLFSIVSGPAEADGRLNPTEQAHPVTRSLDITGWARRI